MTAMTILAQATAPTTQIDPPWYTQPIVPLLILVAIMYLFMFRSQKGKDSQRKNVLSKLKKATRCRPSAGSSDASLKCATIACR